MLKLKYICFALLGMMLWSCTSNSNLPDRFLFLPLNSAVYARKDQRHNRSWMHYYEHVLFRYGAGVNQNIAKEMKEYLSEEPTQERIFSLSADSATIMFWKYNNKTRYFLDHKQDENGDPGNTLQGEDYSDFLGKIVCGPGKNIGELDCLIFISSSDLKGAKVTDSITIVKKM